MRTAFVQQPFGSHVGFARLCGAGEYPNADVGDELPSEPVAHALRQPGLLGNRVPVLHVDRLRNIAQIGDAVIELVSIDVVYLAAGPNALGHEPSKSMELDLQSVNGDLPVAGLDMSGNCSCGDLSPSDFPCEDASGRVVVEQFKSASLGYFVRFHKRILIN